MSTSPALVPAANEQHAHRGGESGGGARGSKGHFPFCSKETHIFLCFPLTSGAALSTDLVEELFLTPSFSLSRHTNGKETVSSTMARRHDI